MNKIAVWVSCLVLVSMVIVYLAPFNYAEQDTGTCCFEQTSKCVVGSVVINNYYYKESGKCY